MHKVSIDAAVGSLLRACRISLDLSQAEAAEQAGCSPVTISRIERGVAHLSVGEVAHMCAVYGVDPEPVIKALGALASSWKIDPEKIRFDIKETEDEQT